LVSALLEVLRYCYLAFNGTWNTRFGVSTLSPPWYSEMLLNYHFACVRETIRTLSSKILLFIKVYVFYWFTRLKCLCINVSCFACFSCNVFLNKCLMYVFAHGNISLRFNVAKRKVRLTIQWSRNETRT